MLLENPRSTNRLNDNNDNSNLVCQNSIEFDVNNNIVRGDTVRSVDLLCAQVTKY